MTHRIELVAARSARWGALLLAVFLCACSSKNQDVAVVDTEPQVTPVPSGPLKAAEIMQALSNRTFKYTRGSRTGTVTFNSDGTFGYEEVGKGPGTGVWQASDGALCEAFDPNKLHAAGHAQRMPALQGGWRQFLCGIGAFRADVGRSSPRNSRMHRAVCPAG